MKKALPCLIPVLLAAVIVSGQQLENPSFEVWENVIAEIDEPVDWNSIKTADDPSVANLAPITFEKSTDAHTGDYSLKLFNVNAFGLTATGAICNGRFHAEFDINASYSYTDSTDSRWHTPFTWRPDSLAGWFKFFPQEDDICQFKVILHVDECKLPENGTSDNWVGMAVYQSPPGVTFENWTRFSVPFDYYDSRTPRYLLCVINSGDSTEASIGSYLVLDDLELVYNNSGIGEGVIRHDFIRVVDRKLHLIMDQEGDFLGKTLQIIGLGGQAVYSEIVSGTMVQDIPNNIPPGIYVAVIETGNKRYVQKIYLGK
jgi:hypothetical protein